VFAVAFLNQQLFVKLGICLRSILGLNHEFIEQELRKLYKSEKLDLDKQMESLSNMLQLRTHENMMRKDVCTQLQVSHQEEA
jgi:hypothetical protein